MESGLRNLIGDGLWGMQRNSLTFSMVFEEWDATGV